MAKTITFHKGLSGIAAPQYLTFEKSEAQESCKQKMNETIKALVPDYSEDIIEMVEQFISLAAGEAYAQGWIDCEEDIKKTLSSVGIDD